jgi:hypothetical protein
MGKDKKRNENYTHSCNAVRKNVAQYRMALSQMKFEPEQFTELMDFYLFHAPILKDKKEKNNTGAKSLQDFGWGGSVPMQRLEKNLIKAANMQMLCFRRSDSIVNTLQGMDLANGGENDAICIEHPRAVLKMNAKVSLNEDGTVKIDTDETRMVCLFRHIRNAIAHNQTYMFENGMILLEDRDKSDSSKITARILLKKETLVEWMQIVKKSPTQENN